MADELERASLLVRVAARAMRAGSTKAAAQTLTEALEIVTGYLHTAPATLAAEDDSAPS